MNIWKNMSVVFYNNHLLNASILIQTLITIYMKIKAIITNIWDTLEQERFWSTGKIVWMPGVFLNS